MRKPTLQALLIADHVYTDVSGKRIIAGTFNKIISQKPLQSVSEEPAEGEGGETEIPPASKPVTGQRRRLDPREVMRAGSHFAYISLTDVLGELPLTLRYVDLDDNGVLLEMTFTVRSEDRLSTVEGVVPVPVLPVPHEGVYALELHCEDVLLGAHRIQGVVKQD